VGRVFFFEEELVIAEGWDLAGNVTKFVLKLLLVIGRLLWTHQDFPQTVECT
jgi:hypothetical protein